MFVVGRNPPAMLRIVDKPIYIRFYNEFPVFSFRCSVRVCYVALWMVWVVLLYNSLHSIAVQQAHVYLDLIFFLLLLVSFSLFSTLPPVHLAETLALALFRHRIRISFFFSLFLLSLLSLLVEIFCFENIISPLTLSTKWFLALLLQNELFNIFFCVLPLLACIWTSILGVTMIGGCRPPSVVASTIIYFTLV